MLSFLLAAPNGKAVAHFLEEIGIREAGNDYFGL